MHVEQGDFSTGSQPRRLAREVFSTLQDSRDSVNVEEEGIVCVFIYVWFLFFNSAVTSAGLGSGLGLMMRLL